MSVGFIRDKLEIKFLILYVAAGGRANAAERCAGSHHDRRRH